MEKEYPATLFGFDTNAEMQQVSEMVMETIERFFSITELDTLHITNKPDEGIIQIGLTYGVGSSNNKLMVIELWADYNLEIPVCDTKLYWDLVDMIAELRYQLMNGDFDFVLNKEAA